MPAGFRALLIGVACTAGCECGSSPPSGAGSSSTTTSQDGGTELGGRRDVTALFGRYNRAAIADELPRRLSGESAEAWSARLNDAGVVAQLRGDTRRAVAAFAQALEARNKWFERAANNLSLAEAKK